MAQGSLPQKSLSDPFTTKRLALGEKKKILNTLGSTLNKRVYTSLSDYYLTYFNRLTVKSNQISSNR